MASVQKKKKQPKHSRWPLIGIGAAGFVLLMFAIGYTLGWHRTGADPQDESRSQPGMTEANGPSVASLADLLPRLEAKVAANPKDMNQRLLLAQTYGELGQTEKSIRELRNLRKADPKNAQAVIYLATELMTSDAKSDLQEANKLLDEAVRMKPALVPMARLYQGDILVKLGDAKGAIKLWRLYLAQMPADDQRRAMFEDKIAQASVQR